MLLDDEQYIDEDGHVLFPASCTALKKYFSYSLEVKSIFIPPTITHIHEYAFHFCDNLHTAVLNIKPPCEPNINMFAHCRRLSRVELPSTITIIPKKMFYSCVSLSCIYLPESLRTIYDHAFSYCSKLYTIDIPQHVTHIHERAFYQSGLKSIRLPESVTAIYPNALTPLERLQYLEIYTTSLESIYFMSQFPRICVIHPSQGISNYYSTRTPKCDMIALQSNKHVRYLVSPVQPVCMYLRAKWHPYTKRNVVRALKYMYVVHGDSTDVHKGRVRNLLMCMKRYGLPNEIAALIYEHLPWDDASITA